MPAGALPPRRACQGPCDCGCVLDAPAGWAPRVMEKLGLGNSSSEGRYYGEMSSVWRNETTIKMELLLPSEAADDDSIYYANIVTP